MPIMKTKFVPEVVVVMKMLKIYDQSVKINHNPN